MPMRAIAVAVSPSRSNSPLTFAPTTSRLRISAPWKFLSSTPWICGRISSARAVVDSLTSASEAEPNCWTCASPRFSASNEERTCEGSTGAANRTSAITPPLKSIV